MSESLQILKLAVCLFNDVTLLDFQGCVEQFGFLAPQNVLNTDSITHVASKVAIDIEYLAPTEDPVKPSSGPLLVPTRTYDSVRDDEQFDLILIPGGPGTFPAALPPSVISFVKKQEPGIKYMLTVCTGSWVLAQAGLLQGKRATTNKYLFNFIKDATKDLGIDWVAKARWTVDGNYWTSSGITAGEETTTRKIRGFNELNISTEGDDEYAAFHGLV
ncbi:hypothetical protein EUX98_g7478 [Antrodiella citrinella]|uniref:DJ-1/PfpI domain-containing protein n=1 Tax=Antrodiella citrinella TaxID=2447956 RepID=A0A4S4MNT6_9APHY|nr:hypothetical protein EUX98_g7478 [Antrodiella citrinella]